MKNTNIIGDMNVAIDELENVKIWWYADDGLHNTIPMEIRMSIDEALELADEINEVVWVNDMYKTDEDFI